MKNKVILSFLIIPIIFACQNNNVNVSSSPEPSKSNIIPSVSPTNSISPTATPTINIVLSPSPSIASTSTPTPSPTIDPDITPIIESNMIPEYKIPDSLPELPKELLGEYFEVKGFVYDRNNNSVSDADIKVASDREYKYEYTTKTDGAGRYVIKIPDKTFEKSKINLNSLYIVLTKENFTKNVIFMNLINHSINDTYNFGGVNVIAKSINANPEIQEIIINGNKLTNFKYQIPYYLELRAKKIDRYTLNNRFIMKSVNKIKIELRFNNSMLIESIENNLSIQLLDSDLKYSFKTPKSSFKWSEDKKKVTFECPINESKDNLKYKFYFTEPFVDTNNNKAYEGEYISFDALQFIPIKELAENIIFEIAGNKGEKNDN